MNKEEIKGILPHREPMLLIEKADVVDERKAKAYYRVKGDEFFLQGHFPDQKIVPGVIQCEMMAQASCVLFCDEMSGENVLPLYTGLNNVRFKNPIVPGDLVEIEVSKKDEKPPFYFMKGKVSVEGKLCMRGEFSFAIMKKG